MGRIIGGGSVDYVKCTQERPFPKVMEWMGKNGISQRELARKSGYDPKTVSCYLLGDTPPSYYFILAVLELSGMTFEEAFGK